MSKKQTTLKVSEGEDFILLTTGGAQISKEDIVVVTSLLTNAAVHIPAFGECIVAVAEMVKKIRQACPSGDKDEIMHYLRSTIPNNRDVN